MPTVTQNIFEDPAGPDADGSKGSSNKLSLSLGYPSAIHHSNDPTTDFRDHEGAGPVSVNLNREDYKKAYEEEILSGIKNIPGSDFSNVDMNYGTTDGAEETPPKSAEIGPDGVDNTIDPSGLGPNAATLDIESVTNPGAGAPMVEAGGSGAPFVAPQTDVPFNSSKKLSSAGLYGSGVKGTSAAEGS